MTDISRRCGQVSALIDEYDRDGLLAVAVASGRGYREIAEEFDIDRRTLCRKRSQPSFHRMVRETRRTALDQALGRLLESATTSVEVLEAVRDDDAVPPSIRIRAAALLLSELRRIFESSDYEDRVAELERRADSQRRING